MRPLVLPENVVEALQRHAAACYPEECCGALWREGTGPLRVHPLPNTSPCPRQAFEAPAGALLAMYEVADREGWSLVGFYHSHCDAEAAPSAHDTARATSGQWTVIVPVARGVAGAPRAYWLEAGRWDEALTGTGA